MNMKKYLWMLAAVLFFEGCGKEEEEGPYVPWRPGDQKEETIELGEATRVMILPEQAKNRIVMIDQPTGKIAWEWKPADSGLSSAEQAWFDLPDEAKPVYNRTCVLVTASGGGVGLIRVADKKLLFYAKPGGNPHSAEVLPDKNIVVASSTGNKLSVYVYDPAESYVPKPAFTTTLYSGHNVVWDRKRGCLWSASGAQLLKFSYNGDRTAPELSQVYAYDMAAGNTMAHDLAPVYGEDAMYVSTNEHVYKFDCAAGKFLPVEIFQQNTIKSLSTGPAGYPVIVMRPTSGGSNWWSAEVTDLKGDRLFNRAGYQIYKARWYVENPFSYPEAHTL